MSIKSNKKMSFDADHAYIFGLEIAVVIYEFLEKQEKNPDFVDENKVSWLSTNSDEWVKSHFVFWSRVKLRSIFDEMRKLDLISINQVNERKRFYRLEKDKISERVRTHAQISNNYNMWISSSSSNNKYKYNNNNTTTTESTILGISNTRDEWSTIDLSLFEEIGFTDEHLSEIRKKTKITPELFANSMRNFIHDYQHGKLSKQTTTNPISSFVRIMIGVGYYNKNTDTAPLRTRRAYLGQIPEVNPIVSIDQKNPEKERLASNRAVLIAGSEQESEQNNEQMDMGMDWVKAELTKILGRETFIWLGNHP